MSSYLKTLRTKQPYAFFVMGAIWLVLALYVGSGLLLWPFFALVLGGLLLMFRPAERVTWAWSIASSGLGIVLALYQAAVDLPLMGGGYTALAAESFVVFVILALLHLLVVYAASTPKTGGS